jgi:dephospho-CoA kinase
VIVIGLTGGIGAGKSTVSGLLARRGAVIVDADLIAREVVEPGGAAYAPIVERFGPGVLGDDGRLDRAAVAAVVFSDPEALAALEAITHPAIQAEMARRVATHDGRDDVVILDIPLLKDRRTPMAGVVVVDVPEDVAVRRLVEGRGFDEGDARRRIAAQISRQRRRSLADIVVDNSGDPTALADEIDRVWTWIEGLRAGGGAAEAVTDRR